MQLTQLVYEFPMTTLLSVMEAMGVAAAISVVVVVVVVISVLWEDAGSRFLLYGRTVLLALRNKARAWWIRMVFLVFQHGGCTAQIHRVFV